MTLHAYAYLVLYNVNIPRNVGNSYYFQTLLGTQTPYTFLHSSVMQIKCNLSTKLITIYTCRDWTYKYFQHGNRTTRRSNPQLDYASNTTKDVQTSTLRDPMDIIPACGAMPNHFKQFPYQCSHPYSYNYGSVIWKTKLNPVHLALATDWICGTCYKRFCSIVGIKKLVISHASLCWRDSEGCQFHITRPNFC